MCIVTGKWDSTPNEFQYLFNTGIRDPPFIFLKTSFKYFSCFRYTDDQMNEEIDRLRRENGWKPRKRGKSQVAIVHKWFLNENSTKSQVAIVHKWFLNENSNKSQVAIVHKWFLNENSNKSQEIIVHKWFLNENSNKSQEIIVHTGLLFKNSIK